MLELVFSFKCFSGAGSDSDDSRLTGDLHLGFFGLVLFADLCRNGFTSFVLDSRSGSEGVGDIFDSDGLFE